MTFGTQIYVDITGTENGSPVPATYIEALAGGNLARVEITATTRMRHVRHLIAGTVVTVDPNRVHKAADMALI